MSIKIVFLGKACIGKTKITASISNTSSYNDLYSPTMGANIRKITKDNSTLQLWDLSGEERYKKFNDSIQSNADIGVYCVDLSQKIDIVQIKKDLANFKTQAPKTPLILVGTKCDLSTGVDPEKKLKEIKLDGFIDCIVTSAKENIGIENLSNLLFSQSKKLLLSQRTTKNMSIWEEAQNNLLIAIKKLPPEKKDFINKELNILSKKLHNPNTLNPDAAINEFANNCHQTLNGTFPNVLKAVLVMVAAATVTVLAFMIGFGIGMAAGAWSGPGAFITALVTANTAAVSVIMFSGISGVIAGAINAYSLFKKSKESTYIDEFVQHVREGFEPNNFLD